MSIESFKRRNQKNGSTQKEKVVNELRRSFDKQVDVSPTGYVLKATIPEEVNITDNTRTIKCLIENITLNDQRVLDEKYIHVAYNENIDIGCYVLWQNSHWLLMFREHNTVDSHKTFTMRRCNQIVKHKYDNNVWEIPTSIENLTMYSDGLADLKMTSQPDSKRHLSFGSNPITRNIKIGCRIMIGHESVFRVTHINDFEYNSKYSGADGLIKALVLNTSFIEHDDKINSVAYNKVEKVELPQDKINGDIEVILGSVNKYNTGDTRCDFKLEFSNEKYEYANLEMVDPYTCKVKITKDSRFVGQKVILKAYFVGTKNVFGSIEIKILGI